MSRPLHVLLIAESFPPSPYVGSVRPGALAEALAKAGHRVTVIRSAAFAAPGRHPVGDRAIRVVTVRAPENPIQLVARKIQFRPRERGGAGPPSSGGGTEPVLRRLRRWVLSLCLLPDESQGFIPASSLSALDLDRADPFDLLVTTGPPFSNHLTGVLLARALEVPWMAEFRDPWMPRSARSGTRSALSDWIEQRLEDLVLRRCDSVVAVTATTRAALDQKRFRLGRPGGALMALNGIPALLPEVPRPVGPIEVLHAGVLYLGRDPRPFLRAVAGGIRAGRFGPAGVRVTFMGASGGVFAGESVEKMAADLGIGDSVAVLDQRPIEECRDLMARADALLLLAQAQPAQIPNKLYDYLAAGRPIIGYVDPGGESAALLDRVGGHHQVPDNDPDHDAAVVEALVATRAGASGNRVNRGVLAELLTEVQMAPLVSALERLADRPSIGRPVRAAATTRLPRVLAGSAPTGSRQGPPRGETVLPDVSVVIPAYNVAAHIGEAVTSVLAQRHSSWELIVVNDGSEDADELEAALAPFRDRLTYIIQENRGPGAARNAGVAAARGTWIAFLDGDDAWFPTYLQDQLARAAEGRLDMVYANAEIIGMPGRQGRTFMDRAPSRGEVTLEALLSGRCNVITSGTLIRREVLAAAGGFPDHRVEAEDFHTWLRVARAGARVGYHRRVLLRHRVRPDGLTGDAIKSGQRAIQALTDAAELPLSAREEHARQRTLARVQRRLGVEQAKQLTVAGDYAAARVAMRSVVGQAPRPKWVAALLLLHLWPGLARRRLLARSPRDEVQAAWPELEPGQRLR